MIVLDMILFLYLLYSLGKRSERTSSPYLRELNGPACNSQTIEKNIRTM